VAEPRLHLDADISQKALQAALIARGHDVSRTPNDWMPLDASDETQLLEASARGRCILTFNVADFILHSKRHPDHAGIILTHQSWPISELIRALDRLLSETQAEEWIGQVRWLSEWR
jgi:hypothetical protein